MITPITTETFDKDTERGLCIVAFKTSWCEHCPPMQEILERVKDTMPEVKFFVVDADEEPVLGNRFTITSFPTLVLTKNGEHLASYSGSVKEEPVRSWIGGSVYEC